MAAVSEALQRFLEQRLTSLDHIAVVFLLRDDPKRSWTAIEVAQALGTASATAAMRLFLLASAGLVTLVPDAIPRYRYEGVDAETDVLLGELREALATAPEAIGAIVEPRDPIRSFADAFKLKK